MWKKKIIVIGCGKMGAHVYLGFKQSVKAVDIRVLPNDGVVRNAIRDFSQPLSKL